MLLPRHRLVAHGRPCCSTLLSVLLMRLDPKWVEGDPNVVLCSAVEAAPAPVSSSRCGWGAVWQRLLDR